MGFLDKINPEHKGLLPDVLQTAEYAGASFGFGYLQNRYRERAAVMGIPVDAFAGGAAKLALLGFELLGWGRRGTVSKLLPHLNVVGNAGVGAFFHTLGAGVGAQKSGMKRLLIPSSDVAKAKAALPNATVLGDIPKAPHGDYLSAAQLAALAR